jgi:hypothetical protein
MLSPSPEILEQISGYYSSKKIIICANVNTFRYSHLTKTHHNLQQVLLHEEKKHTHKRKNSAYVSESAQYTIFRITYAKTSFYCDSAAIATWVGGEYKIIP